MLVYAFAVIDFYPLSITTAPTQRIDNNNSLSYNYNSLGKCDGDYNVPAY